MTLSKINQNHPFCNYILKNKGLIKAEDGMRKLRIMEKSQGIWTMECQLMIDTNFLVVYDKKNGVSFFFSSLKV